jgi:hypothetical protein
VNALDSEPKLGDVVKNESPVELGPDGERYIVYGRVFTKDGWVEMRCLTGN